jgi:hypothetical protein
MASEIAQQLGREHLLQIGDGARGEEIVRVGDVDKARRLLGFTATTPLPEGVARTVAFYSGLVCSGYRRPKGLIEARYDNDTTPNGVAP